MALTIDRADLVSREAQDLIGLLNEELSATYPEDGATHFRLVAAEVAPGQGGFFIASRDGAAVGCGAVRRLDETTCEVKRMFVLPSARGGGVAAFVLARLLDEARALGAARVVLETGVRQAHAIALYRRAGFQPIPAFGEYEGSPLSVCMEKRL